MEVPGYKMFHCGMRNMYGFQFEEGETYNTNKGPGFYYCTKLVSVLGIFYGDPTIQVARVTGYINEQQEAEYRKFGGTIRTARSLRIDKILTREEIMQQVINDGEEDIEKYLMFFPLTTEEEEYFIENYGDNEVFMKIIAQKRARTSEGKKPKTITKIGCV